MALPIWRERFARLASLILGLLDHGGGRALSARWSLSAAATLQAEDFPVSLWRDLAANALPAVSADDPDSEASEWHHVWQFYAADARERSVFASLYERLPPTG